LRESSGICLGPAARCAEKAKNTHFGRIRRLATPKPYLVTLKFLKKPHEPPKPLP
jgi:hypothetical protein